jgi:UDP-N-acetyl-D-mannosaminuronic acid transferase (WecB/TagA/CpsF family)
MSPTRFAILPLFEGIAPGFYSFIGPVAYYTLRDQQFTCRYYCDGMLSARLFSMILGRPVMRTSFDYGSIAGPFFEECLRRELRLLVIGGRPNESVAFADHLTTTYAGLQHRGMDGYPATGFGPEWLAALRDAAATADVVLLALGSPLQERVGQHLIDHGFAGTVITAGAFLSQTVLARSRPYYPKLINALNLRFLWRLIHEPHTRSRFKYVFSFPFSYAIDRARGRVEVL